MQPYDPGLWTCLYCLALPDSAAGVSISCGKGTAEQAYGQRVLGLCCFASPDLAAGVQSTTAPLQFNKSRRRQQDVIGNRASCSDKVLHPVLCEVGACILH